LLPPIVASLAWWLLLDRLPPPNLQPVDSKARGQREISPV
jgi:hypothetical protein